MKEERAVASLVAANLDCRDTGIRETDIGPMHRQRKYRVEFSMRVDLWAHNDKHKDLLMKQACEMILYEIYADIRPLVWQVEYLIFQGDTRPAMELLAKINSIIGR